MALLDGKVAIVTGGASGIGRETAQEFAANGARVCVADVNEPGGAETVALIEAAGGEAIFVRTDVTSEREVEAMVRLTVARFGRLDIAFNNAGTSGRFATVAELTEEDWDRAVALNLTSVWLCMKHEIPAMQASGGGSIINTASKAAKVPAPRMPAYVATKAGVIGLTMSAALDFGPDNIRVNALLPGPTATPMLIQEGTKGLNRTLDQLGDRLPLRRIGQPREQADAVLFLASDQASFLTGQAVVVDGGSSLV